LPTIASLALPKMCEEGIIKTTLMAFETTDNAYVGVAFRYHNPKQYYSFEVGGNFCRVTNMLLGVMQDEPVAINKNCNVTAESF